MSSFYVAAASAEIERAERCMRALREMGHTITEDWTVAVRANPGGDAALSEEQRRQYSNDDLCGVSNADCIWLLLPEAASIGCWIELGYALGLGKDDDVFAKRRRHLKFASGNWKRTIFTAKVDVVKDSDEQVLAFLRDHMGVQP